MWLDHVVIQLVDESVATQLEQDIQRVGLPFRATKEKSTSEGKASYLWLGHTFFEFVRTQEADTNSTILFLRVPCIERTRTMLEQSGHPVTIDESKTKTGSRFWQRKTKQRTIMCEAIPGSEFSIGFVEYPDRVGSRVKRSMTPNGNEFGFQSMHYVSCRLPNWGEAKKVIPSLFPHAVKGPSELTVPIQKGTLKFSGKKEGSAEIGCHVVGHHHVGQSFSVGCLNLEIVAH